MHRYPAAVTEFETVANAQSGLAAAQFFLGNCYTSMGDLPRAVSYYRKAIALEPKEGSYDSVLAQVLLKQSDDNTDTAIDLFEKALALNPSDTSSKQELALCYEKKQKFSQSERLLEDVVRQEPGRLPAHVALARIYYRERKKDQGDRERQIISRLEAEQQSQQSAATQTAPTQNP